MRRRARLGIDGWCGPQLLGGASKGDFAASERVTMLLRREKRMKTVST